MKTVGFALDHIFYPEASIFANIEYNSDSEKTESEPTLKVFVYQGNETAFQMAMTYHKEIESDADAYAIKVTAVGKLSFPEGAGEETKQVVLATSAPNILYGAIREHVLALSARSAFKDYVLPPVIIEESDFVTEEEAAEAAEAQC